MDQGPEVGGAVAGSGTFAGKRDEPRLRLILPPRLTPKALWHHGLDLLSGSLVIYDFGLKRWARSEPWKNRPLMILNPDENALVGVPISTSLDSRGREPVIKAEHGMRIAATAQVTSLRRDLIGPYLGEVGAADLQAVKQAVGLRLQFDPNGNERYSRFKAGQVFELAEDSRSPIGRLICIIGNNLLANKATPIHAIALKPARQTGEFSASLEFKPLDQSRFRGARQLGVIDTQSLGTLRERIGERLALCPTKLTP